MGKIVKFCSSCEEGFAEKFTFCPDCGKTLQAFEMNPLASSAAPVEETRVAEEANFLEIPEEVHKAAPAEVEPVEEEFVETAPPAAEIEPVEEPVEEAEVATAFAASAPVFTQTKPVDVDRKPASLSAEHDAFQKSGDFYVTVIEEKNVKQRNSLMLGSLCLVVGIFMTGLVYNIFSKDLEVGAINDDIFNAVIVDDVFETDKAPKQKLKDDGGGGGGGGDNDPRPASQGERPPMRVQPEFVPSATSERLTSPTIPIQMAIKGPVNENLKVDARYGLKFGAEDASNGPGSGGGIGTGRNGGVGPGSGPGYGPGSNGGLGGGTNGGIGPGGGPGGEGPPPPVHVGVTKPVNIIAKPRANYTDPAREKVVQGTVTLRVTFLASGQIGSISAISTLGYGLTEKAIEAAHQIRFEPAMRNGVPYTVQKTVQYNFTIY